MIKTTIYHKGYMTIVEDIEDIKIIVVVSESKIINATFGICNGLEYLLEFKICNII